MNPSLFDVQQSSALLAAVDWLTGAILGSAAVTLCVIAVAVVGFMVLAGRLAIRQGLRVVLGCFVLLGAPLVAAELSAFADDTGVAPRPEVLLSAPASPQREPPPSNYDPYAGASLRDDQ